MRSSNRVPAVMTTTLFLALTAMARAADSVEIVEIQGLGGFSREVRALNNRGVVAGVSHVTGNLEQHAFLFDGMSSVDLGTLSGGVSQAWGLNNHGHVVGDSAAADGMETHAFLYRNGVMMDLGTLGGVVSMAVGINDHGRVVGYSQTAEGEWRAFVYDNGVLTDLGTLGGTYSAAVGVNSSGMVAGRSTTAGDMARHAFLFSAGQMVDLGTLGGRDSSAVALNDAGMVAGDSDHTSGEVHAFLYRNGQMIDLGTLGGSYSIVAGLNAAGHVVGESDTAEGNWRAFLFDGSVMRDLGTLGGSSSSAWSINNLGEVVGYSYDATENSVAVVWQNGVPTDLNTLLPPGSGWHLLDARMINDAGHVVGFGLYNGRFTQFMLKLPRPNQPPVAGAGADQTVQCPGLIHLDGGGSSDPDGDVLTYHWVLNGASVGSASTLSVSLPFGVHDFVLTVSDPHGESSTDSVRVTVADTTLPTLTCPLSVTLLADGACRVSLPDLRGRVLATDNCTASGDLARNQTPAVGTVLELGAHIVTVTVSDASGNSASCATTVVVVDDTAPVLECPGPVVLQKGARVPDLRLLLNVTDNCGRSLTLVQSPVAGSEPPSASFHVSLVVTDAAGNERRCSVAVTVASGDTKPPFFAKLDVTPAIIRRSFKREMVSVQVHAVARDDVDPAPVCRIVSVTVDEPTVGRGDRTAKDFEVTGPLTAKVRAECRHKCRVYTFTIEARDASGNVQTAKTQVKVVSRKLWKWRDGRGHGDGDDDDGGHDTDD